MAAIVTPEVSILLIAGADRAAAAATVSNLLAQSLADLEILVLTPEAEPDWSSGDPRVRVVPAAAGPVGTVLNQGLASARGELVGRAMPGDHSAPDRLARQAGLLRASAELGFVGTGWRSVEGNRMVRPPAGDVALRVAMAGGDAIGHPTAVARRTAVLRAGGWRAAFVGVEDYDLLLRLQDRHPGACMGEALVEFAPGNEVPGWRDTEQSILSEMAAMAAHDRRQAGRPDHGDREQPVDRSLLHRMGLMEDEISRVVLGRALSMAMTAGTTGKWRLMREAARLGLNQPNLTGEWKSRFMGLWLRSMARVRPLPEHDAAGLAEIGVSHPVG